MRWPWQRKTETRATSYSDTVVNAILAAASAPSADATRTAALEACAATYAAGFACARVEGASGAVATALTPAVLACIARNLIRKGDDVHVIEVSGGMLKLLPAGTWDVRGMADPATWRYRCDLFGPSRSRAVMVAPEGVVHCRYAVDPARPWAGLGPMQWATSSASLAGRLEGGLAKEAGAPAAQLVPIPGDGGDGGDDDPLAELKADIAKGGGKALLVETTAAGWGDGTGAAPRRDWEQRRIGADWPEVLSATRAAVFHHVAAACGVPPVLLTERAEGTSQREGLRRFAHLALEPLGRMVAEELAVKLDAPGLALDFAALMASDLAGRARAYKGFVEAGVTPEDAGRIVALDALAPSR